MSHHWTIVLLQLLKLQLLQYTHGNPRLQGLPCPFPQWQTQSQHTFRWLIYQRPWHLSEFTVINLHTLRTSCHPLVCPSLYPIFLSLPLPAPPGKSTQMVQAVLLMIITTILSAAHHKLLLKKRHAGDCDYEQWEGSWVEWKNAHQRSWWWAEDEKEASGHSLC